MIERRTPDSALTDLVHAIVASDLPLASRMLAASPKLATMHFPEGATRQNAKTWYLEEIGRYIYSGDTALHIAAAGYRTTIVQDLIAKGADVHARNRLGAEPIHAAVVGTPGSHTWDPRAQALTIACLIDAGADPNIADKSGVSPLHRAVRTRCAAAVKVLLDRGADPRRKNKSGSTPMLLATQNTGRGGTGSPEAIVQQKEIVRLLERYGSTR